jgi:hypothetical protein
LIWLRKHDGVIFRNSMPGMRRFPSFEWCPRNFLLITSHFFVRFTCNPEQCPVRSSSVSIVTELRAGRPGFDSRHEQELFSLRHRVQTQSGAHPVSYQMGTGYKVAGTWTLPLTSI